MSQIERVHSDQVGEPPAETWSNCLRIGNQVFIAGMTARSSEFDSIDGAGVYAQARIIFTKIKYLIEAAGGTCEITEVPGALEVPTAIAIADRLSNFDGYVALGCVIRGETTHYDTVCNDSSRGITLLGLQGLCIGNGILTVENRPQAEVRADPSDQNKGGGAAAAALHLIALTRKWGGTKGRPGFQPDPESYRLAEGGTRA